MSLTLLFPLGLLALAAWALPLLLHLARREQRTPTEFAALRWLALRTRPRTRIRLDERLLLALRLALLAAIALLLARPGVLGGGATAWEAIHPALAVPTVAGDDGVERRWLADGFPPIDTPSPPAPAAVASLLRQLDAELPAGASLTVRVPSVLDGLDGERLRLSRPVRWDVVDGGSAPAPRAAADATPALAIRHDADHAGAVRWLRAAAIAWRRTDRAGDAGRNGAGSDIDIDIGAPDAALPPRDDTVLAWLAAGPLPDATRDWIAGGGTALLATATPWPLAEPGAPVRIGDMVVADAAALGRGRVVRLRVALAPAAWPALLEPTFPRTLRELVATPSPPPARGDAAALAPDVGGPDFAATPREFPALLAWAVLALFALERWLATGRRAGDAA